MANKALFSGARAPRATAFNEAGGAAYALPADHELAQYAATGCLNSTYYASADTQLDRLIDLAMLAAPEFVAKTALYCRERGNMKDTPALLCAVLSVRSPGLMAEIFDRVIDSPRMLRNFVQIMRSGAVGRTSLGSLPKRLILQWIESRSDEALFFASIGNDPSLADIIKMVHPKPATKSREALFGYLLGRDHDASALPKIVLEYEAFKANPKGEAPNVPFQMLTSLEIGSKTWKSIARRGSWQMSRINLNTFARHGVYEDPAMTKLIAGRMRDPSLIAKARVFPYQLMIAHAMLDGEVPREIGLALQDGLEIALKNVPRLEGDVHVCIDISGSMHSPVTGVRKGSTTAVRCIDVAGLIAAAILRTSPHAQVVPFHTDVVRCDLNPRDSVMTNARRLAALPSGGTNCSAPLQILNQRKRHADMVIFVSDCESWIDTTPGSWRRGTETMRQWETLKQRSPAARMACVDIQPYGMVQAPDRGDILNVGGFSDAVFDVIARFAHGYDASHWVQVINALAI